MSSFGFEFIKDYCFEIRFKLVSMEKQGNGKKEENSAYKPCESCGIVWNSEAILSSKAIPRYRSQAITSYQANCAGCVNFNEEPMSVRIAEEPVENAEVRLFMILGLFMIIKQHSDVS